ncbi:heme ABC transporter permease [Marinicauda algicola]|uniref:Heme exporter protein C n=1 Tax=Marinicauda algicola TaxID=2029849 RepID=A0A4V3RY74_9PROT|nr:heme ABC transporter permease [Marinicauda algicola]TGY89319.1 heme ABC transporter permease [Marinicauda algicola]
MISYLANPERFDRLARALIPWGWSLTVLLFAAGLPWALAFSPPDYQQSETVRIMYVHVPAAWLGLAAYAGLGVASFVYFVWRHNLADLAARAIAPVGAVFTALCLVTGALWGKPTWGAWWVWDARLTSMLVLLLLYLGYMALRAALEDERLAARAGAILAMAGLINLPVIKFSVDWWNTLHQPASVFRLDGPTIHASKLWPLSVMALAFTMLLATLILVRMRTLLLTRRAEALERARERRLEAVAREAGA